MLATINQHERDVNITFIEEGHIYNVVGMIGKPTSVTTIVHKYFPHFDADLVITKMMRGARWEESKYYGMSREEIKEMWNSSGKEASELGTLMHKAIEDYYNQCLDVYPDTPEFGMFLNFWSDLQQALPGIKPYRTEWLVYDESVNITGSIDCVLQLPNGDLIIADWKRSKEIKKDNKYEKGFGPMTKIDNCNYNHYCLQLNFYRHILTTKYNKNVVYMMLVILHPNQESYICQPVPYIDLEPMWQYLQQSL